MLPVYNRYTWGTSVHILESWYSLILSNGFHNLKTSEAIKENDLIPSIKVNWHMKP